MTRVASGASILIAAAMQVACPAALLADETRPSAVTTIRAVLSSPESDMDFAKAKLTFDKIVDPNIDIATTLMQIDQMVRVITSMAGPNLSNRAKLTAVRNYLYVSGDWNDHKPFQYDMTDPLGKKLANKLLPNYIETRRGNCVTMPILFLILASRLGLPVALSTAPLHFFIKYADDVTGQTINLETTSGAYPARDEWIRKQAPMTDQAIANGVYLRALTKRETLAAMATIVLESDIEQRRGYEAVDVADVILQYYKNFAYAMVEQGTGYALQMQTEFADKYPRPFDIPPALLPRFQMLQQQNLSAFARAEALGWREDE